MHEIVYYNFAFALAVHQREDLLALRMIDVVAVAHRDASYELVYVEAHSSLLFLAKLAQERWLDFESKLRPIKDDGTGQILIDHGRSGSGQTHHTGNVCGLFARHRPTRQAQIELEDLQTTV